MVANRIICKVWSGDKFIEDSKIAFEIFDAYRSGNRSKPISPRDSSSQSTAYSNYNSHNRDPRSTTRQITNHVAKRFTRQSSKYGWESTEKWLKYLGSYKRMSILLDLSVELKFKLFHHILPGLASEHFRANIEGKMSINEEIIALWNSNFVQT